MKKYIILLLSLFFLTACEYKEEPIFDQKPKERTQSNLQNTRKLLEDYDGYWLLTYYPEQYEEGFWAYPYQGTLFPTANDFPKFHRCLGGYNFVLKFSEGKITASSEVASSNREDTSYYSYTLSEFPILSFNTRNDIIHHFLSSTPNYHYARGGEVDFFIDKVENEVFTLKGKRNGNIMTLSKLTTDRETFLNKIRQNRNVLIGKGLSPVSIGGGQVKLEHLPTARQIAFLYDNETKYEQRAYIVTERGIKFYEPVTINNVTLSELYFNDAKNALVAPDGSFSSDLIAPPLELTIDPMIIEFETGKASDYLLTQYQAAKDWNAELLSTTLSPKLKLISLRGNEGEDATGVETTQLYSDGKGYSGWYLVDLVGVAGDPNQVKLFSRGPMDYEENYLYYFKDPAIWLIENVVKNAPYNIQNYSDDYYLLTSVNNSEVWFHLKKRN